MIYLEILCVPVKVQYNQYASFHSLIWIEVLTIFFLQYRNAAHSTTKKSSAELFKNRNLRSSLRCLDSAEVTFSEETTYVPLPVLWSVETVTEWWQYWIWMIYRATEDMQTNYVRMIQVSSFHLTMLGVMPIHSFQIMLLIFRHRYVLPDHR